jgi:hypothetical protein
MALALERILSPATGCPQTAAPRQSEPKLNIAVVFTSVDATLAALRQAGTLAAALGARILLMVPQVVPFPLPLESPPVLLDFNERRFHVIGAQSVVETVVRIYLCRDGWETVATHLSPRSLVVIGGRRRWWPTRPKRLASKLAHAGHEVIFAETE